MFELITNANLYAPQSLGIQHLLVCAGKIVYLGDKVPQLDDNLPVQVTDLNGLRLIPGFIDGHVALIWKFQSAVQSGTYKVANYWCELANAKINMKLFFIFHEKFFYAVNIFILSSSSILGFCLSFKM